MSLQIFDTMTRRKTAFVPRTPGEISMYVCGPTVYDVPHLGHGRTALSYDVIRRYLEWSGYEVTVASNVTDIDDKIVERAQREQRSEADVAAEFTAAYDEQMGRLGVLRPHSRPHATHFISQMIDVIAELRSLGAAYDVPGKGVYFAVDAAPGYGKLAGRTIEQLSADAGARVDVDPDKRSPLDFALWKAAQPGEPRWDTPWGEGRPGWHTECVAMSLSALGPGFDIHGGGDDLVFPHHQNECAQVIAMGEAFARYWVHSAMVNVGSQKMAKSLGNYTQLADAIDAVGPRAVRLLVLQTHYRRTMEMGSDSLEAARSAVGRLDAFARRIAAAGIADGIDAAVRRPDIERGAVPDVDVESVAAFAAAMDDDFSTPTALDVIFRMVRRANASLDEAVPVEASRSARTALHLLGVLGLSCGDDECEDHRDGELADAEVDALLAQRASARASRDFDTADRIRDDLSAAGIVVADGPDGATWHRA
ncbi:cysteine--tRNA ligase [Candidatus Poriferisodalis sp.]|uniref:cysteine--tRNA ligase n=1 Tax=Candidatus Poriferisodalis sp. TaxID=3101277 RepID=UPI003B012DF5